LGRARRGGATRSRERYDKSGGAYVLQRTEVRGVPAQSLFRRVDRGAPTAPERAVSRAGRRAFRASLVRTWPRMPRQGLFRIRSVPATLRQRKTAMLYTIALILVVLWLLGLVSSYTMGGFIHVLLVIAIVVVLVRIISGRRPF